MFCHKCGAQINEGAQFCHKCGVKVVYADTLQAAAESENTSTVELMQQVPVESIQPTARTDKADFKAFVDNHIRQVTKFQSAEELLDSHVPQKFMWICFGIPAVIGFMAGGPLPALLIGLFFGYPAVLITDFIKGFSSQGSVEKISERINSDELIQFLNEHLSYLSLHFHEWGYINYDGFGVRGAVMAHMLNSVTASAIRVGTGFGRKQMCFVEIWIEPDETDPGSNGMKYYFGSAVRLPWPSKYHCMVKAVPVLRAAMEYYLKQYKENQGGDGNVLS